MNLTTQKFEIYAYQGVTLIDKNDEYYTGRKKAQKAYVYVNNKNNDKEVNVLLFDLKNTDNFIILQLIEGTTEEELRNLYKENKQWFEEIFKEKIIEPSYNGEF